MSAGGFGVALIIISVCAGVIHALYNLWKTSLIVLESPQPVRSNVHGGGGGGGGVDDDGLEHVALITSAESNQNTAHIGGGGALRSTSTDDEYDDNDEDHYHMPLEEIAQAISEGANSFLWTEYVYMSAFIVLFSFVILIVLGASSPTLDDDVDKTGVLSSWTHACYTSIAFLIGSFASVVAGNLGMRIAVYSNSRTALESRDGVGSGFLCAFRAGSVMGFGVTSLAVFSLFITVAIFRGLYGEALKSMEATRQMFEAVAGFGLGGSCVAMFQRVGGGIYTKAADVGADLVGKVEAGIPEDDPRNPAVIADNVGDNVGDIAGMGADLFGSFAESTCAAMVITSQSPELWSSWSSLLFPLSVSSVGILGGIGTTFFATHVWPVQREKDVEVALKRQLIVSTCLLTPLVLMVSFSLLPSTFSVSDKTVHPWGAFLAVSVGLWSGLIIGYFTEYYTSYSYDPVKSVAKSCNTGAATNIIYGLSLGYKSTIVPTACMMLSIFVAHGLAGMYGISLAALGILSTLSIGLTIDAFGPISDNAGGIAEMAQMSASVRDTTDCLDAAGNTTAAIGKGFAIGSAALVSLALFGAFVTTVGLKDVNILKPLQFGGLLLGAMLPYWFSAMTMLSVGKAALAMVLEVRRQFAEFPGILAGTQKPLYSECVRISTQSSLKEMIPPCALVIFSPLFVGFFFGTECLAGMLAGALTSGVQMAISSSNTGGAWDNAKKFIEKGHHGGKGSDAHKAAVVGDTVGDPLKDTSGPALNILVKLTAILSLVFGASFPHTGYLVRPFS